jgi:hypothetical protein
MASEVFAGAATLEASAETVAQQKIMSADTNKTHLRIAGRGEGPS